MSNIAILASGSGTNAENIIRYFSTRNSAKVVLVISNKREAYVLKRAATLNIKGEFFDRSDFYASGRVLQCLHDNKIDFIVLAGFLLLVPETILERYRGRIINIHPALLPDFGGKGMFGGKVHEAVLANHETESGITIHHVNRLYDKGEIIFQARCRVEPGDTPEILASRVHELEYRYYPEVIEKLILNADSKVRTWKED
ncbi:MAG: phosphoribosylglycinamide formyltransferase [Bacteroidales bacterium]|jgi:phosphoribosylglycinamide formyltransferase-1